MEGPAISPPANPDNNVDGDANQPNQNNDNNDIMPLLVLQMHLLISLQINLLPSSCPTNLHHSSAPQQLVLQQPPPQQPVPANPAGPLQPVPNWPQPLPHQPASQIIHQQMVNWSHFKPEFAGKPEEDAEAHLLCTNDWMRTHNFEENVKVQGFCLTSLGEARLWYETLNPDLIDWPALQNAFR